MNHYRPSAVRIIENCLPIIEVFSDLESIVFLSQTCHAIRNALIDATTGNIKASHFEVENFPVPHPTAEEPFPPSRNWCNAPARLPHYLTGALNAIHFQSLRRLYLDFPLSRRRNLQVVEDVCHAAFPLFVANLRYAINLEHLHFNAERLMTSERTGQIEALYEVLTQNLQRCTKLRHLSVGNAGVDRNGHSLWSAALLQALIPTIKRRKEKLSSVKIWLLGTPSDPVYAQQLLQRGVDVICDFFTSLLPLTCLETLELTVSSDHIDAVTRAFDPTQHRQNHSLLKRLSITQSAEDRDDYPSVLHILDHFSECDELNEVKLDFPSQQWRDCHHSLQKLVCNKPNIESISLCFSCYPDTGGKMMKALVQFSRQSSLANLQQLSIYGLFHTSSEDFVLLQQMMAEKGMHLSRCREKFGKNNSEEFNLIICVFKKQS